MEQIQEFFTDSLIKSDTSRQVRALMYYNESRNNAPIALQELPELLDLLQIIQENIQQTQIIPENSVGNSILLTQLTQKRLARDLFSIQLDQNSELQPWALIPAVFNFLNTLLSKGIFYTSNMQLEFLPCLKEIFSIIAEVFLLDLPDQIRHTDKLTDSQKLENLLLSICECFAFFAAVCRLSENLNQVIQPVLEFTTDNVVFRSLIQGEVLQSFHDMALMAIGKFAVKIQSYKEISSEILEVFTVTMLYFLDLYTKSCEEQFVIIELGNQKSLVSQLISYLSGDILNRQTTLTLTIMQRLTFVPDCCDQKEFAHTLSIALFQNGWLEVKGKYQIESQLAILNIIERATRSLNQFIIFLCQDLPFNIQDNFQVQKVQKKKINKNRIIDDEDSDSELQPQDTNLSSLSPIKQLRCDNSSFEDGAETIMQHQLKSNQSRRNTTKLPQNPVDPFRSRSTSPTRFLQGNQETESKPASNQQHTSQAFVKNQPSQTPANFVIHYLLQLIKNYGKNLYHSSRKQQVYLQQTLKNQDKIRQNVPDGHTVNFTQLNKLTVEKFASLREIYNKRIEQLHVQDSIELQKVEKSTKYENIRKARLYAAQEKFDIRDASLLRAYQLEQAKVGREGFTTEFIHNDDYRNTLTTKRIQKTATQLINSLDTMFEVHYIIFTLQILSNICMFSRTSPSRAIKLSLQNMDSDFVDGTVKFVQIDETTDAALQLIYAIITFPSGNDKVWDIFINNGLFDFLNNVNNQNQIHSCVFISKLLGNDFEGLLNTEKLKQLVESTIDSFIQLFDRCEQNNLSNNAKMALTSITFLICNYAIKLGEIQPIIQEGNFQTLIDYFLNILQQSQHHFQYLSLLCCYGIFGIPKRLTSSRLCYDCGIFKQILDLIKVKYQGDFKLQPQDFILIRLITDVLISADNKLVEYTKGQIQMQDAFCRCYQVWQQTLGMRPFTEDSPIVLPSSEFFKATMVVPRGNIFEVSSIKNDTSSSQFNSRRQSRKTNLSPTRQRVNLLETQSRIKKEREDNVELLIPVVNSDDTLQSFMSLSDEARYLVHCNFSSTILALFRSLYPNMNQHSVIIQNNKKIKTQQFPNTGRLSTRRPTSGTTPKIGMKLPMILPNLAGNKEPTVNNADLNISINNVLVVLQAQSQSLKESLLYLQLGYSDAFLDSDKNFIKSAIQLLEARIQTLKSSGEKILADIKKEEVEEEASYYSFLKD
ncbi:hypothetical protein SS50377_23536 [Spironucleus salmonicida]|uniref:Uncharacterized protein n=1 Tax=Spironucleus salmonicida TaxID=348837 RepID=V6M590_9EUKA|nr:hypothetical protein SS50377_23536 [Spironucleus salmonicida]|eukprot:EST48519.1 hypothetical protein SS50377_11129 [Spironucleus salmonicida]